MHHVCGTGLPTVLNQSRTSRLAGLRQLGTRDALGHESSDARSFASTRQVMI